MPFFPMVELCAHSANHFLSQALFYFQYEWIILILYLYKNISLSFACHWLWYDAVTPCRSPWCSSGRTAGAWSLPGNCAYQLVASHYRCCRDLQWRPCHWIHYICWQEEGKNLAFFPRLKHLFQPSSALQFFWKLQFYSHCDVRILKTYLSFSY